MAFAGPGFLGERGSHYYRPEMEREGFVLLSLLLKKEGRGTILGQPRQVVDPGIPPRSFDARAGRCPMPQTPTLKGA